MMLLFLKHVSIYSNNVSLKIETKHVYLLELKIEILLVSFTNLILTLKYSVITYTDLNDNV